MRHRKILTVREIPCDFEGTSEKKYSYKEYVVNAVGTLVGMRMFNKRFRVKNRKVCTILLCVEHETQFTEDFLDYPAFPGALVSHRSERHPVA